MNKLALALCAVALATVSLCAADVAGTWNVDGDVVGNPVKFPMTLQQDGEALTGTATLEGGKDVAVKGTRRTRRSRSSSTPRAQAPRTTSCSPAPSLKMAALRGR